MVCTPNFFVVETGEFLGNSAGYFRFVASIRTSGRKSHADNSLASVIVPVNETKVIKLNWLININIYVYNDCIIHLEQGCHIGTQIGLVKIMFEDGLRESHRCRSTFLKFFKDPINAVISNRLSLNYEHI